MALNTTVLSGYTADKQTYYDRRFLEKALYNLHLYELAQRKSLPANSGKTVNFTRYLPLATKTTALTETTTGGTASGSQSSLKNMTVSATAALYGNVTEISHLDYLVSLDKNMGEKIDVLGMQAKETLDELMRAEFATYCNRVRSDGDTTYTSEGVSTAAGTTTTIVAASQGGTDDDWNGATVTVIDRTNNAYAETRIVSDYTSSSGTITVSAAFSTAPGSGCTYRLVKTTGLSASNATDLTTHASLSYVRRELKKRLALPLPDGGYTLLLDPSMQYDFMIDSTVTGLSQQSQPSMLEKGIVGQWMGLQIRDQSIVWREAVSAAGTEVTTGAVHLGMAFGSNAIGVVELADGANKIYVKHPDQLGQAIPYFHTIGWETGFVAKTLNGCWTVGLAAAVTG